MYTRGNTASVLYSVQRQISDGSLEVVTVKIPYQDKSTLHVLVDDVQITSSTQQGTPYTWVWDGQKIRITPAVANGSQVLVRRVSTADRMKNIFNGQAEFTDEAMDQNFKQLLWLAQEYGEGSGLRDVFSNINMHGYKITNVGQATQDDDVVTFGQYRKDALGANTARDQAVAAKDAAQVAQTKAEQAQAAAQKATAQGTANADLAKQWATKMDDKVNGQDYSSKYYANRSETSATVAGNAQTEAKQAQRNAEAQAADAKASASTATTKASEASASASKAKTSETNAKTSESNAKASETKAKTSETNSKTSETNAKASQDEATRQAELAKEYANKAAGEQIQSDWAQSDSSEKSYIKNKPDLSIYALLGRDVMSYGLGGGQGTAADVSSIFGSGDLNDIDKTGFYTVAGNVSANTPNGDKTGVVLHIQRRYSAGASAIQLYCTTLGYLYYRVRNQNPSQASVLPYIGEMTNEEMDAMNQSRQQIDTTAAITSRTWTPWYEIAANGNNRGFTTNYIRTAQTRWGMTHMAGVPNKGDIPSTTAFAYHGVYDGTKQIDNSSNRLGVLQFAVRQDGSTQYRIIAYQNKAGSDITSSIGAGVKADGTRYTYAPTPVNTSNDDNIATTAFTQTVLNELKTALTSGSVVPAKASQVAGSGVKGAVAQATHSSTSDSANTALSVAWEAITGKPAIENAINSYQISGSSGYIRFENKIQIVWGSGTNRNKCTFIKPFSNTSYSLVGTPQSSTVTGTASYQKTTSYCTFLVEADANITNITYIAIGAWA